jgi:rhamnosyltransferase
MKSKKHKVLCAIVTFNGANTISDTLKALLNQTVSPDEFLIIDNASGDKTLEIVDNLAINNHKIIVNKKNEGVAVVYNQAVGEAVANNFDWLWLFDQDSHCLPDCLEKLLAEAEKIQADGHTPAALFPSHYSSTRPDHLFPPGKWNGTEIVYLTAPEKPAKNHTAVHTSMTSGALYNLAVIKKEEPFRKDFFIDYVDHEYHIRLHRKKHQLFWVHKAKLFHNLGKTIINPEGQFLIYHDSWRYYFMGRNMFICFWNWGGLPAVYQNWKSFKQLMEYYKCFKSLDHAGIWKYYKLGIRDFILAGIYRMKQPASVRKFIE